MNYLLEAHEENDFRKDRTKEECKELEKRLNLETVFAKFEDDNGDIYEGEWRKCKKDGKETMQHMNGNIYEGDWKNGKREGEN